MSERSTQQAEKDELRVPPRYFDLDDIIAMNTPITCTVYDSLSREFFKLFNHPVPDVIDSKGIKVNVPLWLLGKIRNHCEINVPKAYNDAVQQVLAANAESTDLERLQQYFYYVGIHLSDVLEREDGKKLADCLLETLVKRIGGVVSKALQGHTKLGKLDQMEKVLFDEILVWRREIEDWMSTGATSTNKRKHPI